MKLKRIASKLHQAISPQARSRALQIAITSELKRAIEIPQPDFSARLILPDGFGRGLLERVPELLLAYLACRDGVRILDIGHANAAQSHLNMISLLPSAVEITGMDIAEPTCEISGIYKESIRADISDWNTESRFDLIWCISTLEHFGMDNHGYTDAFTTDAQADFKAMRQMVDLLADSGRLLVTVPYGVAENHGWFRNGTIPVAMGITLPRQPVRYNLPTASVFSMACRSYVLMVPIH